jgi:hypothetical protein
LCDADLAATALRVLSASQSPGLREENHDIHGTVCSGKSLSQQMKDDVDELPYSAEDRIKLTASDYVIGSFVPHPEKSMLFVTQTGKVLQRECDSLELSKSPLAKGQALIPPSRLEQGVRFIGAAAVRETDRIAVLDSKGNLKVHLAESIIGAGSIEADGLILSIGVILGKANP